ncbi:MAG: cytochrome c3 family protein [Gracilibacteraceae bacterium]|jgi:nitrate/TMAO reductase-like tetraheme cytochrome c subunit|nr:cytochrome c3 family protein [Gracilibacteraceae bacterium]
MDTLDQQESSREPAKNKKLLTPKKVILVLGVLVLLGAGGGFGVMKASDNPAFCTLCHNMQKYYDSFSFSQTDEKNGENYDLLAKRHADSADALVCHDCHEASLSVQLSEGVKFITGNYLDPLERRDFGDQFCLDCHDFEEVKQITRERFAEVSGPPYNVANPHDSHNGELDCSVCHRMHQKQTLLCAQCHELKWTGEVLRDAAWIPKLIYE